MGTLSQGLEGVFDVTENILCWVSGVRSTTPLVRTLSFQDQLSIFLIKKKKKSVEFAVVNCGALQWLFVNLAFR